MSTSRTAVVRVPPEHRFLGLDKRSIPLALVAALIWGLWVIVVPWIDGKIAWDDEVEPGDVFRVHPGITITPPAGWGVQSGIRTTDDLASGVDYSNVVLVTDGLLATVTTGNWDGTPLALLDQIVAITTTESRKEGFRVGGQVETVTTTSGATGVAKGFVSARNSGFIAAFVFKGTGVQIQVVGTAEQIAAHAHEVTAMVESLDATGAAS